MPSNDQDLKQQEDSPRSRPISQYSDSQQQQQQFSSSPRWRGIPLPWSRRGSQKRVGATEQQILAAMKEANEDENFKDRVVQEDRGWYIQAYEEAYRAAADQAEYGVVDLNSISAFSSPICHFNPQSTRMSQHSSHHQQSDSVASMQQFYYQHSYRDEDRPLRYHSWDFYSDSQESQQYKYGQDYGSPSTTIINALQLQELRTLSSSPEQLDEEVNSYINGDQEQPQHPAISNNTPPDLTLPNTHLFQPLNTSTSYTTLRSSHCFVLPSQTAKMRFTNSSLEQDQIQYSLGRYPTTRDPSEDAHICIDTLSSKNTADAVDILRIESENAEPLPKADSPTGSTASQFTIIQFNKIDSGIEETEEAVLYCSCSFPNWETVKAGILPTSKNARGALMASIVLALVAITLEAVLLYRHGVMAANLVEINGPFQYTFFRPLQIYYTIFIIGEIFAVGLLWDAATHKNSLQLFAFTMFEWCIVSYSALQIWQHNQLIKNIEIPDEMLVSFGDSTTRAILFSQLGFQIAACLGITLLTWKLYSEFGWVIFQKLGADVSLRKMMKEYRMLFTLLKLDSFMFFGYAIQVAALTDEYWKKGLIEVAFAIPLSAVIIFLGYYATRNENKVTMGGFIACLGLLIGYMTYRLVALNQTVTGDPETDPFFFSRKTMTVFAALTLFMTILALINAIVMLYNFDRGLKEAIMAVIKLEVQEMEAETEDQPVYRRGMEEDLVQLHNHSGTRNVSLDAV
ncbi:hypothetical protein BGZ51_003987 [Haplosporangium sp. Z 767]|nr:hypothetical protein BGZ51_003987 [Haplosporangium sp. Z 767]